MPDPVGALRPAGTDVRHMRLEITESMPLEQDTAFMALLDAIEATGTSIAPVAGGRVPAAIAARGPIDRWMVLPPAARRNRRVIRRR